jgi:hypothetical protein
VQGLWFYDNFDNVLRRNQKIAFPRPNNENDFPDNTVTLRLNKKQLARIKLDMKNLGYLKLKNRGGRNLERIKDLFG